MPPARHRDVRDDVLAVAAHAAGTQLADEVATGNDGQLALGAASPWLTVPVAADLARGGRVRASLAGNPAAPPGLLRELAHDPDPQVSRPALRNPACPFPTVNALAPAPVTLRHPDCPPARLRAALTDRNARVNVLTHPATPWEAILAVRADLSPYEEGVLLGNAHLTHADAAPILARSTRSRDILSDVTHTWARHPNADPGWLRDTARQHVRSTTRRAERITLALAGNPTTPADVLETLVTGHCPVSVAALAHPASPETAMHRTIDDDGSGTGWAQSQRRAALSAIAANPTAPAAVLDRLAITDTPLDLTRDLTRDPLTSPTVFDFVAAHASCGEHARVMLTLAGTWSASLLALLETAATILQDRQR